MGLIGFVRWNGAVIHCSHKAPSFYRFVIMFNSGLGGFHSDVLSAEPTDDESKIRLIEEIKNRAKGSLSTKNYPEAIQLYSKGIELKSTDAILYANRSMCYLQMGNADSALQDAERAIEHDASYAKYVRSYLCI